MLKHVPYGSIRLKRNTAKLSDDTEIHFAEMILKEPAAKTAIYIHGGGFTGNHTLSVRPSKHLLLRGLFDRVILPDRRGAGLSSPFTKITTFKEQAADLKRLLDFLNAEGPVTAIGVSYGGPVALYLASMDKRIDKVILAASSPTLKHASGFTGLMIRTGLLSGLLNVIFYLFVGRGNPRLTHQDEVYDAKNVLTYAKVFISTLIHSPREMVNSYRLQARSFIDKSNLEADISLNIPVLQVIGDKDEFWGRYLPDDLKRNYPYLKRVVLKNAGHKAAFLRADEFLDAIEEFLS